MGAVKNKNSKLETMFRKELWKHGFRYRKNVSSRFGKPDIVLSKYKTVIFIDSCFWHFCPLHGELPKNNFAFWEKKLNANRQRDEKVTDHYMNNDWNIIRIWEHELMEKNHSLKLKEVIKLLEKAVHNKNISL